ncbi:MAG: hypothetical protein HYR56_35300 [Acidobacteria bacterium]|nr:hypothetical protein [Acidobacteriota bacterium]MBI3421322.1 hypothetical protein [Acidobacteriota bacterium]
MLKNAILCNLEIILSQTSDNAILLINHEQIENRQQGFHSDGFCYCLRALLVFTLFLDRSLFLFIPFDPFQAFAERLSFRLLRCPAQGRSKAKKQPGNSQKNVLALNVEHNNLSN